MILTRQVHYEQEIFKWVVLLFLAMLLVALVASTAGSADGTRRSPPQLLPAEVLEVGQADVGGQSVPI